MGGQHLRLLQGQQPQVSVALEGALEVVKVDIVGCLKPTAKAIARACGAQLIPALLRRRPRLHPCRLLRLLKDRQQQVSAALEAAAQVVRMDGADHLKQIAKANARACGAQVKPALSMSLFEAERFNSSAHNGVLAFPLFFHFATSFLGTMPFAWRISQN